MLRPYVFPPAPMSRLRSYAARLVPERAPVQTWMLLTFVLFVGMGVAAVVLYVTLVLRGDAMETLRATLGAQAERVADVVEAEETEEARLMAFEQASRALDLRFALVYPDGRRVDYADGKPLVRPSPAEPAFAPGDSAAFRTVRDANGDRVRYAAVRLRTGEVLEVGQPEPALFTLVERMRRAVFVGMAMALALALAGTIVVARQVTRPLRAIRDAAKGVAEGEYARTIAADSRAAEFQDVAKSLNRMSEAFRTKIGELERMAHIQSEFIGNVSHEVRNPIFSVGGYLEALASPTLPDDKRREYGAKALAALGRLQALFGDLIELARLEYREDLLRISEFDLQELLDEVGEMLRLKAEEKGLALELRNPPLAVRADRNRVRQVVTNLIENAIAYTDEGTIRCRLRRRLGKVRVEVVDTGQGIPEDKRDRIFDRFYRVDPSRSRKSGGTGLGLSIVKQILQAHGEPIHVESTLGRGSRFWFELPYAGPDDGDEAGEPDGESI